MPTRVARALGRIADEAGVDQRDGTLREAVAPYDVIAFGAMLAQPRPDEDDPEWGTTAERLLDVYSATSPWPEASGATGRNDHAPETRTVQNVRHD